MTRTPNSDPGEMHAGGPPRVQRSLRVGNNRNPTPRTDGVRVTRMRVYGVFELDHFLLIKMIIMCCV